jgi:hypothetical protein
MEASSWRLLDGAKSNTTKEFLQRRRERSKKLQNRGGFQAAFPLTHMNRHNNKHAGKTKTKP